MIKLNKIYRPPKKIKENPPTDETMKTIQEWFQYTQYLAEKHKIQYPYQTSYQYCIINNINTPAIILPKTVPPDLKEDKIQENIEQYNKKLLQENLTEKEHTKQIINHITNLYTKKITRYEKVNQELRFRVTPEQEKTINDTPGKTNREKLNNLIKNNKKHTPTKYPPGNSTKIVQFRLTKAEYEKFKKIKGKTNKEKLLNLI